jgi:pilus assembly protein Flp/PilA
MQNCQSAKRKKAMPKYSTLRPTLALMRQRLAKDEEGATAIEYALIASGIGAAIASTVWGFGSALSDVYQKVVAIL